MNIQARIDRVQDILQAAKPYSYRTRGTKVKWEEKTALQAYRIAWRQLKDFIEQCLLAVETGLFPIHEVFAGQVETRDPDTGEVVTFAELIERHGVLHNDTLQIATGPPVLVIEAEVLP